MPRYLIESGELEETIEACDADAACEAAVKLANASDDPPALGLLMSCVEIVGEKGYISTEAVCKRAGCWAER